ncbi:MAG: penicillin-binding protein family, nonfunctional [Candidatus Saccharibacteria bacterium]|nr:penicillin-binding protein family, nonfunctional [Candidatus Saccharibacteria bacterium]
MPKYTRIKSYSPKRTAKVTTPVKKRGPVVGFFVGRLKWFKGLSKPKKAAVIGGPILAFLIITPLITYIYFANAISDPDRLMNYNNTGVVLLDKNGDDFYSFGTANRGERVPLDQISDFTEKALVSAEDKNFYKHGGFSPVSILGALYANLLSGDATGYGGSTLTQQLAKNTLLSNNQTVLRKYQELTIALAIEQNYTKDEILDLYLNSVYYGEGAFGIGAAAQAYFGKPAADLDLAESAMLIGVLPAPSAYSPISGNIDYAKERQATVLSRMVDNKVITQAEADAATAKVLAYASPDAGPNGKAPHFAELVLDELYEKYGEERVTRSGFRVTTTLDMSLQESATAAVDKQMNFIQRNGGSNAAVVAIDPTNGEVRALVGSADYNNADFGKVNMATTARQPGSSIKPLYYTEALQRGIITPGTILKDEKTDFGGYQPQNADRKFRGNITVRNAISQSLNIPSVEVMQKLGVGNAVEAFQRLGLSTVDDKTDYGLSLALGSAEAKLTDMTNAYAAFANTGNQYDISTISRIDDKFEKQIFKKTTASGTRVMGENASFLISDILNDEAARAPIFGTSLNTNGFDVAVKTGTTDEARDAWTIGYAKQLAVGVWVGNNNNTPMKNGGSSMAGPIWRSVIQAGLKGQKNQPFTAPSGVERLTICRSNGQRATGGGTEGTYQEYFLRTASPTGTCDVPKAPEDADKDGVIDENDECADTPAGTEVDDTGCPVEEEDDTPTAVDTDADGVIDSLDQCANTPAGTKVDATGCPTTNNGNGNNTTPANPRKTTP